MFLIRLTGSFHPDSGITMRSMRVLCLLFTILPAVFQGQILPSQPVDPANPVIVVETSLGDIVIELRQDRAPVSVQNFLAYAKSGHYDGTVFHRVLKGFMIQGGGYDEKLDERPTRPPIRNEATNGLRNMRGTVAMARSSAVRSAMAEFFINVEDNSQLNHRGVTPSDYGYAVFGRVLEGMDVVDKIAALPVRPQGPHEAVPVEAVVIKRVRPR
jgi:cyclophilin family peptidyl-prolyl cis-trans isomerase